MLSTVASAKSTVVLIDARRRISKRQWSEVWRSRELIWLLAKREVQLRYRFSIAGISWAIFQPVVMVLALTAFQILFGHRLVGRVAYPLYAMLGLVPWTFFGHALAQCSVSILKHTAMMKKVYFPLLVLPLASVIASTVDFVVALPLVAGLMMYYGYTPGWSLLLLPLFVIQLILFTTGAGIWLALLNTRFRDTANALPFVMQIWFLLSPIVYSTSQIPERWRFVVGLNPMVGVLEGFRWALSNESPPERNVWIACSALCTMLILSSGLVIWFFKNETLRELN